MKIIKSSTATSDESNLVLRQNVKEIIEDIKSNGQPALLRYCKIFDWSHRKNLKVSKTEIKEAYEIVGKDVVEDISSAISNIEKFAIRQKGSLTEIKDFEVSAGIFLGQKVIPVESCMCYVPSGKYPLFSSAIMQIIPAKVAGVKKIVACSPPIRGEDKINPITLVAMDMAGADEIYALGGVQSIAAFSYGTEEIEKVNMIVGPGNMYVTEAKRQCFGDVGIDSIAGPSEVLIVADSSADPCIIAADILAQCEHDVKARGILLTTDEGVAATVMQEVEKQLFDLPSKDTANISWENNSEIILVDNLDEAAKISNSIAPEHLELCIKGF
ncbi:MAG: histidinol dehydrogenase, partial [Anaerovoracaceae bacterium]